MADIKCETAWLRYVDKKSDKFYAIIELPASLFKNNVLIGYGASGADGIWTFNPPGTAQRKSVEKIKKGYRGTKPLAGEAAMAVFTIEGIRTSEDYAPRFIKDTLWMIDQSNVSTPALPTKKVDPKAEHEKWMAEKRDKAAAKRVGWAGDW